MKPKQIKQRAIEREAAASRRRAAVRVSDSISTKADAAKRMAEIPADTRNLTATIFGDPIPGDPRCPWRPSSQQAA